MDSPQKLRILAAGDLHGSQRGADWLYAKAAELEPDLVLFLGDFVTGTPLSFAVEVLRELRMLDAACYVIPGNWDPREITVHMDEQAYDGLRNLHKASAYMNGYSFAGLGGSIPTPSHKSPIEAPDESFADPLITRMPADIWVLHNPLRGFRDFATAANANIGSESLLALYNEQVEKPLLVVSGHIHEARGIERGGPEDATLFVNPGPLSQFGAALITLQG
ncbi:MAG: metallophosphoesterase, partial [bacterium]|nr:metallophosphoesterase [bacterium]